MDGNGCSIGTHILSYKPKLLEEEVGEGNGAGIAMLGIGDVVGRIAADEHVIGIDALGQVEPLSG